MFHVKLLSILVWFLNANKKGVSRETPFKNTN